MDASKRQAISSFYREEFRRHLDHLQAAGILHDTERTAVGRACRRLMDDLDSVTQWERFPLLAETLLQRFDTLTQLSRLESHRGH